jgi:hypothetical protein
MQNKMISQLLYAHKGVIVIFGLYNLYIVFQEYLILHLQKYVFYAFCWSSVYCLFFNIEGDRGGIKEDIEGERANREKDRGRDRRKDIGRNRRKDTVEVG